MGDRRSTTPIVVLKPGETWYHSWSHPSLVAAAPPMTDSTEPAPARLPIQPPATAMSFTVDRLQMNPDATIQDVRDLALLAGLSIHPMVFRCARIRLGLERAA